MLCIPDGMGAYTKVDICHHTVCVWLNFFTESHEANRNWTFILATDKSVHFDNEPSLLTTNNVIWM